MTVTCKTTVLKHALQLVQHSQQEGASYETRQLQEAYLQHSNAVTDVNCKDQMTQSQTTSVTLHDKSPHWQAL